MGWRERSEPERAPVPVGRRSPSEPAPHLDHEFTRTFGGTASEPHVDFPGSDGEEVRGVARPFGRGAQQGQSAPTTAVMGGADEQGSTALPHVLPGFVGGDHMHVSIVGGRTRQGDALVRTSWLGRRADSGRGSGRGDTSIGDGEAIAVRIRCRGRRDLL
jgi:hypothetical protein